MIPALFDLDRTISATQRLMQYWAHSLHDTLVSLGVPSEYAQPDVLLKMPSSIGLFLPVMLLAGQAPVKIRNPIILLGSLLFALTIFGYLYTLALLSAVVFTYAFHHIALTIIHFHTPPHLLELIQKKLPSPMTAEVLHSLQEWERRLTPWRPKMFLAMFWVIATATTIYCFRRANNWFVALPPPVHFMHISGLAFLYIKLLAYSRDCLLGHLAQPSLFNLMNWVFFHPTIRLGPILRYGEFQSMMATTPYRVSWRNMGWGALRLLTGNLRILGVILLLKFAEPPPVGWSWLPTVQPDNIWRGFVFPQEYSTATLLFGMYLQLLRFYLLFSAAADMAVGLCWFAGVKLPENFQAPLIARNIADFWRRWHISLGSFCRTDIYIPLGGNRRHTTLNYFAVFLFIGLWHELGWTFALWGALQAVGMAIHRWYRLWQEKRTANVRSASGTAGDTVLPPTWRGRLSLLICVFLAQAFATLSFAGLYDNKASGLLLFEVLIRRMLGNASGPVLAEPLVQGLNAMQHQLAVWTQWPL